MNLQDTNFTLVNNVVIESPPQVRCKGIQCGKRLCARSHFWRGRGRAVVIILGPRGAINITTALPRASNTCRCHIGDFRLRTRIPGEVTSSAEIGESGDEQKTTKKTTTTKKRGRLDEAWLDSQCSLTVFCSGLLPTGGMRRPCCMPTCRPGGLCPRAPPAVRSYRQSAECG